MKRSANRILTTHVGSLARPGELLEIMRAKESGHDYDVSAFQSNVRRAVNDVVSRQLKAGIDVICDGEQGKSGFLTYVSERLGGFKAREEEGEDLWKESRETLAFPEFYQSHRHYRTGIVAKRARLICTGPITYIGHELLRRDIENVKAATEGMAAEEVFMTAISPSDIEGQQANEYYRY